MGDIFYTQAYKPYIRPRARGPPRSALVRLTVSSGTPQCQPLNTSALDAPNALKVAIASSRHTPDTSSMFRFASSAAHSGCTGPSSNPVSSSNSLPNPAMASDDTPDHSVAPKHMAHGSQFTTNCRRAPPAPKFQLPIRRCARDRHTTSACAEEQLRGTTRLTPTDSSSPVSRSNTAAANGPPVPSLKLRSASCSTSRMRSSTDVWLRA
mmetsp:Transcript_17334/g.44135  ORF Transcript_17334/g.44135 Transcript_17334/m.44135 type:complete len:209 (+) Transcript_17334:32-658(+)